MSGTILPLRRPTSPIQILIDQATGYDGRPRAPRLQPGRPPTEAELDVRTKAILEVVDAAKAWKYNRNRGPKRHPAEERLVKAVRAWERLGG